MNFFWRILPLLLMVLMVLVGIPLIKRQMDALYNGFKAKGTEMELKRIATIIRGYYLQEDVLPPCDEKTKTCPEIMELIEQYLASKKKKVAADVWGTPYAYVPLYGERQVVTGFELRSAGPDKKWLTEDDILLKEEL